MKFVVMVSLLIMITLCCPVGQIYANGFDLSPYQEIEYPKESLPADFFYPRFFRETESVSYRNIVSEIKFRLELIAGLNPEPRQLGCYKVQRRIDKAIQQMKKATGIIPFKSLDSKLLFDESSPLSEYLRPPSREATVQCSYHIAGDIEVDGFIFCKYHGPADDSVFYKKNRAAFDTARPLVTSFEIVEFLIFLPALVILPITWYVMKKILAKS